MNNEQEEAIVELSADMVNRLGYLVSGAGTTHHWGKGSWMNAVEEE